MDGRGDVDDTEDGSKEIEERKKKKYEMSFSYLLYEQIVRM